MPLLSWGTLSTRKAVEAPDVDHLTANAEVRGAYSGYYYYYYFVVVVVVIVVVDLYVRSIVFIVLPLLRKSLLKLP